jgi:hypothetical protein
MASSSDWRGPIVSTAPAAEEMTPRERVASALAAARGKRAWRHLTASQRAFYLGEADVAIAALGDAEATRLREALADALVGMRDMIEYVPTTFRRTWRHDEYIERALKSLGGVR